MQQTTILNGDHLLLVEPGKKAHRQLKPQQTINLVLLLLALAGDNPQLLAQQAHLRIQVFNQFNNHLILVA